MLVASELYTKITNKMENIIAGEKNYPTSALDAFTRISNAIGEYISDNAVITYSWVGTYTPPPPGAPIPDPVVSFTADITYNNSIISVPSDYATFVLNISSFLKNAFTVTASSDWSLTGLALNPLGAVSPVMANETSYQAAMTSFCNQIITQFKTNYINPTPASGTHLPTSPTPFIGATTSMTIV